MRDHVLGCLEAGARNILCEKSLALTGAEALEIWRAADEAGAVVVEGFMYRHHPAIARIDELLAAGSVGQLDNIWAAFSLFDPADSEADDPKRPRVNFDECSVELHKDVRTPEPAAPAEEAVASQETAARDSRAKLLGRSARFEIAVAIRKSDHAIGVGDIEILRLRAGRIKGKPERFVELIFGENFNLLGFPVAILVAHDLDLIGAALADENVSVRRSPENARITKTGGILFDLESGRDPELGTARA